MKINKLVNVSEAGGCGKGEGALVAEGDKYELWLKNGMKPVLLSSTYQKEHDRKLD